MNRISIFTFFLLLTTITQAQVADVNIKNGPSFDPKGSILEFIGEKDGVIYYTSWKRKLWLGGINASDLSLTFETEVVTPEFGNKRVSVESIFMVNKKLLAFCTAYDKATDEKFLIAQKLTERGSLDGAPIELDVIQTISKRNSGDFTYDVNEANGRILIFTNPPFEKYDKEKFHFKVYDENLKLIWNEKLEMPYPDKYFTVTDFMVDASDVLYMTCTFNEFEKTKQEEGKKKAKAEAKERGGHRSFKVISYNHQKEKLKEYEIELNESQGIESLDYNLDVNGNINVAGLYSLTNDKNDGINGVYFIKINSETGDVMTSSIKAFEKKQTDEDDDEIKKKKKDADAPVAMREFEIREFINRDDGGLIISGEYYNEYTRCTTDPRTGSTTCTTYYIYGNITIINVDAQGNIEWQSNVPKYQRTANDGGMFSSYALMVDGSELYYFYNDNAKNYDAKKKDNRIYGMTSSKKSVTTIAHVDADGNVTKEPDAKLRAEKKMLRPKVSRYIVNDDKLIVLAKWRKQESVVEIKVK
ncbi:MAG: hypothetical protein ACKVOR_00185 [Flavobacteriales bacterium]